jgi:hypothetical protein
MTKFNMGLGLGNGIDTFFANRTKETTLLLSAENLSNPFGFEDIFKGLEEKYRIKIIIYIRRQMIT